MYGVTDAHRQFAIQNVDPCVLVLHAGDLYSCACFNLPLGFLSVIWIKISRPVVNLPRILVLVLVLYCTVEQSWHRIAEGFRQPRLKRILSSRAPCFRLMRRKCIESTTVLQSGNRFPLAVFFFFSSSFPLFHSPLHLPYRSASDNPSFIVFVPIILSMKCMTGGQVRVLGDVLSITEGY